MVRPGAGSARHVRPLASRVLVSMIPRTFPSLASICWIIGNRNPHLGQLLLVDAEQGGQHAFAQR